MNLALYVIFFVIGAGFMGEIRKQCLVMQNNNWNVTKAVLAWVIIGTCVMFVHKLPGNETLFPLPSVIAYLFGSLVILMPVFWPKPINKE